QSDGEAGPHTLGLGRYLFEQGVGATFFVMGRHAEEHRDILGALKEWGHLVGNHTYSHPRLVGVAESGGAWSAEWRGRTASSGPSCRATRFSSVPLMATGGKRPIPERTSRFPSSRRFSTEARDLRTRWAR